MWAYIIGALLGSGSKGAAAAVQPVQTPAYSTGAKWSMGQATAAGMGGLPNVTGVFHPVRVGASYKAAMAAMGPVSVGRAAAQGLVISGQKAQVSSYNAPRTGSMGRLTYGAPMQSVAVAAAVQPTTGTLRPGSTTPYRRI